MIVLVNPKYNPNFMTPEDISSDTRLGVGITIAKFLGSYGNRTSFNHIYTGSDRQQLARQLYLHAELMQTVTPDYFDDVRLIVSEGVYKGGPSETIGGDNIKKADGRIVVYQVIGKNGEIDHERTFDVAEYWKDYMYYGRISLDYDHYEPSGKLTSQILVEMPTVTEAFDVNFTQNIETYYNGSLFSANELVEII